MCVCVEVRETGLNARERDILLVVMDLSKQPAAVASIMDDDEYFQGTSRY